MKRQLNTLSETSKNPTTHKRNTPARYAGEVSLMGENHDHQTNQDTRMRPNTRKDLVAFKGGTNDGEGK